MKILVVYLIKSMQSIFIFISVGIILISCDLGNEVESGEKTSCFIFVDDFNNNPIESVNVTLYTKSSSGVSFSYSRTTNNSGECCFEYESRLSLSYIKAQKDGYYPLYEYRLDAGYIPPAIRLVSIAYLKLHVQNIPPSAQNDSIKINYPGAGGGINTLIYVGAYIDTTVTLLSHTCTSYLSWTSRHDDILVDSTLSIIITSQDTTYVQILY